MLLLNHRNKCPKIPHKCIPVFYFSVFNPFQPHLHVKKLKGATNIFIKKKKQKQNSEVGT